MSESPFYHNNAHALIVLVTMVKSCDTGMAPRATASITRTETWACTTSSIVCARVELTEGTQAHTRAKAMKNVYLGSKSYKPISLLPGSNFSGPGIESVS